MKESPLVSSPPVYVFYMSVLSSVLRLLAFLSMFEILDVSESAVSCFTLHFEGPSPSSESPEEYTV